VFIFGRAKTRTLVSPDAVSGVPKFFIIRFQPQTLLGALLLRGPTFNGRKRMGKRERREGHEGYVNGGKNEGEGPLNDFLAGGMKFEVTPLLASAGRIHKTGKVCTFRTGIPVGSLDLDTHRLHTKTRFHFRS